MEINPEEQGLLIAIAEHPEEFRTYLENLGLLASFQQAMSEARG